MPGRPTLTSHLAMSARWPGGVLATAWAYTWRTTPLHRRELPGSWDQDGPPPLPADIERSDLHTPADGAGPLLHRRYHARIVDTELSAAPLIAQLGPDPNRVAPGTLAKFVRVKGDDGRLAVGDEFVVRMPGPWDGPVRVIEVTPTSFRLATLEGHLEAGQIEWHARDEAGALVFGIESWARSGDRLSDLLHNRLRMAKEVQLHMWTRVIERVARLAGGRLERGIDIETRRVAVSDGA
jgi:Domain of unknown function (DUF1990)